MASREHLRILTLGVKSWNKWREDNPKITPNLYKAKLSGADLEGVNFSRADLSEVNLSNATLIDAKLNDSVLVGSNLKHANFARAELDHSDLSYSNASDANIALTHLIGANLKNTTLHRVNFLYSSLNNANLAGADLARVTFTDVILEKANFTRAVFANTVFAGCDLSAVKGLNSIKHKAPSYVDILTIYQSGAAIPEKFLRGIGIPETFVTYASSLTQQPIKFYSCFISYSSKDQAFAERLYADLQNKGVRCWFAPVDLKIGEKFRKGIDESIRVHDKLLLVLSKHSTNSAWVEKEVETAFEQENKQSRTILFPIRLDDTVMKIESGWAADIRKTRHLGDFKKWKDHDSYQESFDRLLRDLKTEE
jgi:uncharacterized protein YjbI with pentapeptide repeats